MSEAKASQLTPQWARVVALALVAAVCFSGWVFWQVESTALSACPVQKEATSLHETTRVILTSIIDFDIALATTLVGLTAALLLGVNKAFKLTPWAVILLLYAIGSFTQAAIYSTYWKSRVALVWYAGCPSSLVSDFVQRPYTWHVNFFLLGVLALSVMVVAVSFAAVRNWKGH